MEHLWDAPGNPSTQPTASIVLSAHYKNLEVVRSFVGELALRGGFRPEQIYEIQLAVDEAFTNIIEHAYHGEKEEPIECVCTLTPDALIIVIQDYGAPFNPEDVPEPDVHASLHKRVEGGLGLYFIRHLMDEVDFYFSPASGHQRRFNLLRMVKYKERRK